VTRLGEGVDATGRLGDAAMERVFAAVAAYREAIDAGVPFRAFDVGAADWIEIDDEADHAVACRMEGGR
jgi:hypothetical protein